MNPAPILDLTPGASVVHGIGCAVYVEFDRNGWVTRRTFRSNR